MARRPVLTLVIVSAAALCVLRGSVGFVGVFWSSAKHGERTPARGRAERVESQEPEDDLDVLRSEAARLRLEADALQAASLADARSARAMEIVALGEVAMNDGSGPWASSDGKAASSPPSPRTAGREQFALWLQTSQGFEAEAAGEAAAQMLERLLLAFGSGGVGSGDGDQKGERQQQLLSLEELATETFEVELGVVLQEQRARIQRAQQEQRLRDVERQQEAEEARELWTPEMLNDDRSFGTRAWAALPYLMPLFDQLQSALPLAAVVPSLKPLFGLLSTPFALYAAAPFGAQFLWFVFFLVANNRRLPRLVRYSLQQAVLLDVTYFVLSVLATVVYSAVGGMGTAEESIGGWLYSVLFATIVYCFVCCALGRDPDGIPVISESTEQAIDGPPPIGFGSGDD